MRKKKRQKPVVLFKKRSFDDVIANFKVTCSNPRCNEPLVIHAYRQKSHNSKEMIYAHCENAGSEEKTRCFRFNQEICFIERFF